jgi:hypothetical protein
VAQELIGPFVVFGCVLLAVLGAQAFAARTAHLRLGLFHPYRGDPWPIGVQEDDDFHFTWTPQTPSMTAPDAARRAGSGDESGPGDPSIETVDHLASGSITPAPVGRIQVRRAEGTPRRDP